MNELDTNIKDISNKLVKEDSPEEVEKLIQMFNLNQVKKEVLRVSKLNETREKVEDQMAIRVEERPEEFSNRDLLDYANVLSQSIDKSSKVINQIDTAPLIQLQQNNVSVTIDGEALSSDERKNVLNALDMIKKLGNVIDVEEEK